MKFSLGNAQRNDFKGKFIENVRIFPIQECRRQSLKKDHLNPNTEIIYFSTLNLDLFYYLQETCKNYKDKRLQR